MRVSLSLLVPTVILFHLFQLDQTAAGQEECVMRYVHMASLCSANGSNLFEWPIYEHLDESRSALQIYRL